ncbi:hypothetical protein CHS0354_008564 [Potamilus streckersoni]|uniref:RCC1-like domain-containing protein n=1 Tax=Potamilus streckersoni TaxID=2493646 RepID=A0AAE0RSE3_9BIVA|nr:hypothetical protein CHS0354_008564 [Potamilus streckersoni]
MALSSAGSVYTCGLGKSGQLGRGGTDTQHTFGPVKLPEQCYAINSGGLFTAVVTTSGAVYTFGCGKHGRLGTGHETDQLMPCGIKGELDRKVIQKVSCGSWHGAAVSDDKNLFIWGHGRSHGVMGYSPCPDIACPTLLTGSFSGKVAGVACGNNFTLMWTVDGMAFSWGSGRYGVLGQGNSDDCPQPIKITGLQELVIVHMDAGFAHNGAVTSDGVVYMFGRNDEGALGLGGSSAHKEVTIPQRIPDIPPMTKVSCSVGEHHGHTLFLARDGTVFACGDGYKGKLGFGNQQSLQRPVQIPKENFSGEFIIAVSSGGIHSAAVSQAGHLFTWGCGSDGRLGHPEGKGHRYLFRSDIPKIVPGLAQVIDVSCSYYHTVALLQGK